MNSIAPTHSCAQTAGFTAHSREANSAFKPLKIALLGYRSHPFVGGQGIYIKYLSRALKALGHTVHVYSGQPYPELDDNIPLIKVPSLNLYESDNHVRALRWQHLGSYANIYEWWTMLTGGFGEPYSFGRRVRKLLRHEHYDIVHDNQSLCHGLVHLQQQGHTVISTIHHPIHRDRQLALEEAPDWGFRLLVKRWHSFLGMQEKVANKLKHIVTVSEQSQRDIAHFFRRDSARTPIFFNGVDTELFCPPEQNTGSPSALCLLTTSSSDQPLKGLRYLLEALAEIKKTHNSVQLDIIGELKPNGDNAKLIETLGLAKHIHCHSGLSTDELIKRYHAASIVVCPSLYEGFGLPAAEAMACGRPVISSDGGALPEVVGDAGLIVPAGDSLALQHAICSLWENQSLQTSLSAKARARALNVFSWQRVAKELTHYYHSCIENKGS